MATTTEIETGNVRAKVVEDMLFFLKPEVNTGQLRSYDVFMDPRDSLSITSEKPIEFIVPANSSDYLNLAETELQMKIKLVKKDENVLIDGSTGTNTEVSENGEYPAFFDSADSEFVVPVDCFFQTQWEDIILELNDTIVTNTARQQGYASYLDIFLRTQEDQMDYLKYRWMFTKGTGELRKYQPNPYKAKDKGAIYRSERTRYGPLVELAGKVWTDFWKDPKLLLMNGVQMKLTLKPAADIFRFRVCPQSFYEQWEYKIESCKLKLRYVTLSSSALRGISHVLDKHPIMYPFVKSVCKKVPLNSGRLDISVPDLFDRQVPIDIVLAMVDVEADNGSYRSDPFFFNRNNVKSAAFYIDNVSIPGSPLEFDRPKKYTEEELAVKMLQLRKPPDEWQMNPLESLWEVAGNHFDGFDKKTLVDGNFLISFKTDPTVPADVPYWGTSKTGNTSIHLSFYEPIPSEQTLIILARFPAVVSVHKNRKVTVSH